MTAAQLVTEFQNYYPDCPSALAETFLQRAHDRVLGSCRLRVPEVVDITPITENVREYTLSDDVLRTWSAYYMADENDVTHMEETSIDLLDNNQPMWRFNNTGAPYQWYDVGNVIGLVPLPNTSTGVTYPLVRLYTSKRQTLSPSTTMPAQVPNYDAWTTYMCRCWASMQDLAKVDYWDQRADQELAKLVKFTNGRQVRNKGSVTPQFPTISNY